MKIVSLEQFSPKIQEKLQANDISVEYVLRENIPESLNIINNAEILICRDRDLRMEFVPHLKKVKFIFIISVGVNNLPFSWLKERNISVANAAGVGGTEMANYAIGAVLLFSSKFKECIEYQKTKTWFPYLMSESLTEKRVLIVGMGNVGRLIAKRAKVLGLNVVGIRNSLKKESDFDDVKELKDLSIELMKADFVICTLPLTEITRGLFNYDAFSCMNANSVFINISRGALVNEKALIQILREKKIKAAVLDVFEQEPLPKDSPLWELDNVVITPHSSARTPDFLDKAMEVFQLNFQAYLRNEKLPNQIDLNKGY